MTVGPLIKATSSVLLSNTAVPQESCSGPMLWIIVANTLLSQIEENTDFANVKLVAFENDFLFVPKAGRDGNLE